MRGCNERREVDGSRTVTKMDGLLHRNVLQVSVMIWTAAASLYTIATLPARRLSLPLLMFEPTVDFLTKLCMVIVRN
jgi:hypothetical protein